MANPVDLLHERLSHAIEDAFGPSFAGVDPGLRRSAQPQFGDYQANFAMGLAKRLGDGRSPRDVAGAVVERLDVDDLCSSVEVAGPGFVNLTLSGDALGAAAAELLGDERNGVPTADA